MTLGKAIRGAYSALSAIKLGRAAASGKPSYVANFFARRWAHGALARLMRRVGL